ncbi:MAG: twin-arginine translocase subunit TatC, partial [Planctomycetota bacterium]
MDAPAKSTSPLDQAKMSAPKDDLFENSTMTFGEHLEELRHSLVRALICLGIGLAIGLTVANQVVRYVAEPLKVAILDFNAKKHLSLLGYDDLEDPAVKKLLPIMTERSLKWKVVYDIPEELQNLDATSVETAASDSGEVARVKPREIADILKQLPDPSML